MRGSRTGSSPSAHDGRLMCAPSPCGPHPHRRSPYGRSYVASPRTLCPRASSKARRRRQVALHADPGAVDVPTHCTADGFPRDADVAKVEADSP